MFADSWLGRALFVELNFGLEIVITARMIHAQIWFLKTLRKKFWKATTITTDYTHNCCWNGHLLLITTGLRRRKHVLRALSGNCQGIGECDFETKTNSPDSVVIFVTHCIYRQNLMLLLWTRKKIMIYLSVMILLGFFAIANQICVFKGSQNDWSQFCSIDQLLTKKAKFPLQLTAVHSTADLFCFVFVFTFCILPTTVLGPSLTNFRSWF